MDSLLGASMTTADVFPGPWVLARIRGSRGREPSRLLPAIPRPRDRRSLGWLRMNVFFLPTAH